MLERLREAPVGSAGAGNLAQESDKDVPQPAGPSGLFRACKTLVSMHCAVQLP